MDGVCHAIDGNDKASLDDAVARLKPASDHFAGVIMDKNVKDALAGTRTSDW